MYTLKVYEINELSESIRKAEKLGSSRRLLMIYGINNDKDSHLKINEILELETDTSYVFKVVRFLLIRKIPYIENAIHIVIEPISTNAISISNKALCNLISCGVLRHTKLNNSHEIAIK